MDEKQFRELRTLILDLMVEIQIVKVSINNMRKDLRLDPLEEIADMGVLDRIDVPDDLKKFFKNQN